MVLVDNAVVLFVESITFAAKLLPCRGLGAKLFNDGLRFNKFVFEEACENKPVKQPLNNLC